MRCEFCGKGVAQTWQLWDFWQFKPKSQQPICQDCWGKFTPIIGPTCQECGRASRQETCEDCQVWLGEGYPPLKNQALFKYDAMMHDFFQQYKFRGGYHLRTIFQDALQKRLAEVSVDMIVPIPVSPDTLAMRGFNQVNGLLEICEIDDILCCISHNKSVQSLKTRQDRLNAAQPFMCQLGNLDLTGQRICLVDDVYTTGRTLRHAATCLYECGAKQICTITLAR
ncbi:ComF family protein [Weissella confusa]|uniref:ComF family protein n=1 Tax=Weissella confusa TaxID=1583 RepID=UPI00223B1A45|nr:ComF family protein [Weissella confusa]MCT0014846.1 ComF family protein [Weissella confusa]